MVVERKLYVDLYFLGNKIFLEQYTLKMKTLVFIKKLNLEFCLRMKLISIVAWNIYIYISKNIIENRYADTCKFYSRSWYELKIFTSDLTQRHSICYSV